MISHQTKLGAVYVMREFIKAPNESEALHLGCRILRFLLVEWTRDIQNRMHFLVLHGDLTDSGDATHASIYKMNSL